MSSGVLSITVVLLVAVIAPIVASFCGRFIRVPLVVFEIVLGMLVGPSVLDLVDNDELLTQLSNFGLVMLFFMAGNEIDFTKIARGSAKRATVGWLVSLALGVGAGVIIAQGSIDGVYIGIALSSTALGTIMPILRDAGNLQTPLGRSVLAVGTAGEFLPLLAISIFLSGRQPLVAALILLAFVAVAALSIWLTLRRKRGLIDSLVTTSLHTSGQFAVRLVLLVVASLVALSLALGLDMLLGAFAAGILIRALLRDTSEAEKTTIERKLEAISFGFLVPVFFVTVGTTFDFHALLSNSQALVLLPIFVGLLLIVRGIPGSFAAPPGSTGADRRSLALLSATGLPIIIAVTGIAQDQGSMDSGTAAALIGAGMISVLVFPLVALRGHKPAPK